MEFLKMETAFFVLDTDNKKVRENKKYALCGYYKGSGNNIKIENIATGDVYDLKYDKETGREYVQIGTMRLSKIEIVKDWIHFIFEADQKSYANKLAMSSTYNLHKFYSIKNYELVSKRQILHVLDEINKAIHDKQVSIEKYSKLDFVK